MKKELEISRDYWNNGYWQFVISSGKEGDVNNTLTEKYSDYLNSIRVKKAMDVGCGLGYDTKYLISKNYEVTSCDFSSVVLEKLQENIPEANTLNHNIADKFQIEDDTFGVIVANLSLHYFDWDTTKKIFNELKRLLVPGGLLIGRVNSNKHINASEEGEKIDDNFYYDRKNYRRFFDRAQFNELSASWQVETLTEETVSRLGREKSVWEFVFRKENNE